MLFYYYFLQALENCPQELENSPQAEPQVVSDNCSSDYDESFLDDFSDTDSCHENQENINSLSDKEKKLLFLADMGYTVEEASIAMDRCGPDSSVVELTDFISAAQISKAADADLGELSDEEKPRPKHLYKDYNKQKKRKFLDYRLWERKKQRGYEKKLRNEDDEPIRLPNPMVGFGVPAEPCPVFHRTLPEAAVGPPYFYYENVALAPKGEKRLYSQSSNSKQISSSSAPSTNHIRSFTLNQEMVAIMGHKNKIKLHTDMCWSAKLTDRIRKALEEWDGVPPMSVQKYVLDECRKWNLVWVGRNKLAPLEPDEVEMLLGFPRNHTRGGGISRTDRYKSLATQILISCYSQIQILLSYRINLLQVDTVAYHFSVLKDMFPGGITLLSLFSGIGGAEIALHRLGIPLKNVVAVEISETNRNILRSWWEQTNQRGTLVDIADVQQLNGDRLEQLIHTFGGFDLIVGGSPCNNLAGSNRVSRDGLEGKESALFYDYFRILDLVKCIMGRNQ
ncbi:DNA (cytosine-5)-methyltransferase DRM2 [Vitis vinifera]|uniref:DNA (cytosine-5-)-methyltransferase n=1 Tax=Vitis vinifera TaxID=29760 RepID=A0A438EFR9_VITVI|nr:DNA (cytosine-5)-methyltransferase DRM2 [Vitis vinifera]